MPPIVQRGPMPDSMLDLLACPVCRGRLKDAQDELACSGCGRVYPFEDGIAILLADRARPG